MQLPCQQCRRRDLEAEIVRGEIRAIAVADIDPVNLDIERDGSMQSRDRDGEIRSADRLLNGAREPGFAGLHLQQAKTAEEDDNQQTERDSEPAKDSYDNAHQKACPRLI
jgi:hypothetical protein